MPSTSQYRNAADVYKPNFGRRFVTPAGVEMTVKDLELEDMARAGLVEQFDTLGMIANEKVAKVQGKRPNDRPSKKPTKKQQAEADAAAGGGKMLEMMRDPEKFAALAVMMDKVIVACVLEPVFESPYIMEEQGPNNFVERKLRQEERLEGALYADYVKLGEKMAIFGEVFQGVDGLEDFRKGSGESVGDVETESGD